MIRIVACIAAALMLSLATCGAFAAVPDSATVAVTLGPGSVLWLEGKSTLHDFESRTSEVGIALTRSPDARAASDVAGLDALIRSAGIRTVQVQVPVHSLRSDKSGLDKNLWKDLQADAHPLIRFQLTSYAITPDPASADTVEIRALGVLEVAGSQQPDTLAARAHRTAEGLWLEGSNTLRMSEFGIHPPTMMLGTLRVADPIVVHYRLLLVPAGEASPPRNHGN